MGYSHPPHIHFFFFFSPPPPLSLSLSGFKRSTALSQFCKLFSKKDCGVHTVRECRLRCRAKSCFVCNTLQHAATHCSTLQHTATHCNTLQHTATHCDILKHIGKFLQHVVTHCKILRHIRRCISTAVRTCTCTSTWTCTIYTLQQSATHCNTLQQIILYLNCLPSVHVHVHV